MLFEFLLVIPSLLHLGSSQGERDPMQSATPDPLEELFGQGRNKKEESWSNNLLFGDVNLNEISNSLVSTPPPLLSINNRGNSNQNSLPSGLSFLNGGGSFSGFLVQDTNPPPVDQSNTGGNGLMNIPPMPNFDQMGLESVLDKFLPVDGSVRLPPPSNEPIIHSRENVPIPSIGQLGIDTGGLFGQGLFSSGAGSLSNTPISSSGLGDSLPGLTNNNNNNNQIDLVNTPSESPPLIQSNLAPKTVHSQPERSADQKAIDQLIWDSMIPPLPKDRKPIEVFPRNEPKIVHSQPEKSADQKAIDQIFWDIPSLQTDRNPTEAFPSNEPTPKPKRNKKSKKRKPLLPLLPPSPTRKSSHKMPSAPRHNPNKKDETNRITKDILLDNIPSIDQLGIDLGNTSPTSPKPFHINDNNLLDNIPSINQLENDLFGSGIKNQGTQTNQNVVPTEPSSVGNKFQFPDQFSGGNRHDSSAKKNKQNDSMSPIQTAGSQNLTIADPDTNSTTLENIWNILVIEIPDLLKITGEDVPSEKPKSNSIEDLLGISANDIDSFNANHNPTIPQETKPRTPLQNTTPKPLLPVFLPTKTSPTVYVPPTTVASLINMPTTTTTLPPMIVYTTPPTTTPRPTTLPPTTTTPSTTTSILTTPQPIVYNTPTTDIYLLPTNQPLPPDIYVPPTLPSFEKTTTQIKHVTIDFKINDQDKKKLPTSKDNGGGELPFSSGDLLPPFDLTQLTLPLDIIMDSNKTKSANNINPMVLPSEPELPFTTPFSILSIAPSIPDRQLEQPKFEDLGIYNDNNERNPFTQIMSKESRLPNQDYTIFGGNPKDNEQTMNTQSRAIGLESLFGNLGNNMKEQSHIINADRSSKGNKQFQQSGNEVGRGANSHSNSLMEPYTPTTTAKPHFPGLESLIGEQKEEVKPTTMSIPKHPSLDLQILDGMNKDSNHEQQMESIKEELFMNNIKHNEINSLMEPYTPNTAAKPHFPGLESLIGEQKEEVKPTTMSIPKHPSLDLQILDGMNKDSNHEQQMKSIKDEPFMINIKHDEIKDVPPLDIDVFGTGFEDLKIPLSTPTPLTSTLPFLPPHDFLSAVNNAEHEPWNVFSEGEGFGNSETGIISTLSPLMQNQDQVKRIIDSGPKHNDQAFENSVPIPRSLQRNNQLPFVAPTSEASKHFLFHDQLNGGNIRSHNIFNTQSTTPKTTTTDVKPKKPNILVIDIVNKPADKTGIQTGQNRQLSLHNTNNVANTQQDSNSRSIGIIPQGTRQSFGTDNSAFQRIQQVTPTPNRATTPSWLAATILAIRSRLNQLRALRNNRQNNRNNNGQNAARNHIANDNSNRRQSVTLPSILTLNQRNNDPSIQNRVQNRLIQNGNLHNVNTQRSIGNGFPSQVNFNNFQFANRASSQNQPLVGAQQTAIPRNAPQQRTQFQIPNNQLNQQNTPPFRQPSVQPTQSIRQLPSSGTQNSQTPQNGVTQAETELLRQQFRQRIQRVIRTQLLRNLLIRRLQALRAQRTNNAQQTRNQPIWRVPTSSNNMNIMNANNAINLIRQARQRALTASQQQHPNNQPSSDLSRNAFERFPNRNFQNVGFRPNQFGRQQTTHPVNLSRLLQTNRGLINNRIGQSFQRPVSNGTNGNNVNRNPRLDLSQLPSELALRTLQNLNLQRTRGVRQDFPW
ncbi:uncharacterized protein LOC125651128 isoform X2 [Ostrea edulis]|uniref:uncharacterized protein LOC125651128 isoform X2 n=1 Tax=Ostrea edulis TaxID=37623 RepID=UPI0024AF4CDB|nr:uncharacterized protein LOC125651128 isoform X2 [Ostrea edulis]